MRITSIDPPDRERGRKREKERGRERERKRERERERREKKKRELYTSSITHQASPSKALHLSL